MPTQAEINKINRERKKKPKTDAEKSGQVSGTERAEVEAIGTGQPSAAQALGAKTGLTTQQVRADAPAARAQLQAKQAEEQKFIAEQTAGLQEPEDVSLAATEREGFAGEQETIEQIPVLGAAAVTLGRAAEADIKAAAYFGVIAESISIDKLANFIGAGDKINTPKESAESLQAQLSNTEREFRNEVRRGVNNIETLQALNNYEEEIEALQIQIKENVILSAALQANPEDIELIEDKLDKSKRLLFQYKREILTDPNGLANLKLSLGAEETLQ